MSERTSNPKDAGSGTPSLMGFRLGYSHIVHELRTPLSEIRSLAELAQASRDEGDKKRYLDLLLDSSSGLLDLVNHLLDDPSGGMHRPRPVPVDVEGLVRRTLEPLALLAELKDLRLNWEFEGPDLPAILADPVQLVQVLRNLVSNALKYTERGEILVLVSAREDGRGGLRLRFLVKDTGIGIAPENRKDLFMPFRRLPWQDDSSRRPEGSGLGLSLVKHLVEGMKGSLDLDSIPGQGSVFRVDLPVEPAAGESGRQSGNGGRRGSDRRKEDGRRPRILIAEDNSINLVHLSYFLESRGGYEIFTARDGKDALSVLRDRRIDLVLMDLNMPVVNGLEAAKAIRSGDISPSSRNVPIIALTAHVSPADRNVLSAAGFNGIAVKPVSVDRLIGQIERSLLDAPSPDCGSADLSGEDEARVDVTFDAVEFCEKYRGADRIAAQVLAIFAVEAPLRIDSLKRALSAGDEDGVRKAAHSLANICGTVCAKRGTRLARETESASVAGDHGTLAFLAEELAEEIVRVSDRLNRLKSEDGNGIRE